MQGLVSFRGMWHSKNNVHNYSYYFFINPAWRRSLHWQIFEYLLRGGDFALGSPDESVVKDLLDETQAGHYVSSLEGLEATLSKYYSEYIEAGAVAPTEEGAISKYSQHEMARKFASVLNNF